jgi:hypothetical protein
MMLKGKILTLFRKRLRQGKTWHDPRKKRDERIPLKIKKAIVSAPIAL